MGSCLGLCCTKPAELSEVTSQEEAVHQQELLKTLTDDQKDPARRRWVKVQSLDGQENNIEVAENEYVVDLKAKISELTGVHQELQELFDPDMEDDVADITDAQLSDDYRIPNEMDMLTVMFNEPAKYEVTPGPPLNCREEPSRAAKVMKAFVPGDIVGVIGPAVVGGGYGGVDGNACNMWLPVLTEVIQNEPDKDHPAAEAPSRPSSMISRLTRRRSRTEPAGGGAGAGADEVQQVDCNPNNKKTKIAKAWCGCGTIDDPYLVPVGTLKKPAGEID